MATKSNADKDFMGLTTWTGVLPTRTDAEYAKNYLSEEEIKYTYDKNGRLTLYANNERNDRISFQYNKQGYLTNITDSSYGYQISRDENGLITNVLIEHRGGYFSDTTLEFEYY